MNKRVPEHAERISVETADALAAIGNRIRDLRGQKALTLQGLSELTGLSPSMLSLVERGQTSPSIGTLVVISSALGVHMSDLLAVDDRAARDPVSRASEQPIYETARGVLRRILREDRIRGARWRSTSTRRTPAAPSSQFITPATSTASCSRAS
jgi:transcriptional regulator with XRE-family HTH domain